jgi:DNA-binding transcriptional regulator YhcF (GntR family)
MPHLKKIIWRGTKGEIIACVEKNKVMQENLQEIRQVCQDALDDAVLMGCDEKQVRDVLTELIVQLKSPYPPRE